MRKVINTHQERRKNLFIFITRHSEEEIGFEGSNAPDGQLTKEESEYFQLLIHKIISAEDFPIESLGELSMFIQSNPGAHRIIASEPGFLIPHLIKYSYIEIKNPSNLTILLEIFAELTCSEDIIDYLLEEKISILCDILISDNPDDIKCKSLTILHHIASKGESYCFKQFEEVQLASDPSRRASPIQCVIYVIDEQSTGKSNAEFPELQAYLCSPDARQFATDEDNVRLQKLCLKFLTALVSKKQLPYNSLLSEILEHIVKCTFIREPSIRHISLYSCIDCSENYFDYFFKLL